MLCNLSSQKYICVTHLRTHYFRWQVATGTLEPLAQLVNARESYLSIKVMSVHTQANWDN